MEPSRSSACHRRPRQSRRHARDGRVLLPPPDSGRKPDRGREARLMSVRAIYLCIGVLLLTSCSKSDRKNPLQPAPMGAKVFSIAFSSQRDGNSEIYVMNSDSTDQERLTTDPGSDDRPDWSPDGTRIVFESSRDGNAEIYV